MRNIGRIYRKKVALSKPERKVHFSEDSKLTIIYSVDRVAKQSFANRPQRTTQRQLTEAEIAEKRKPQPTINIITQLNEKLKDNQTTNTLAETIEAIINNKIELNLNQKGALYTCLEKIICKATYSSTEIAAIKDLIKLIQYLEKGRNTELNQEYIDLLESILESHEKPTAPAAEAQRGGAHAPLAAEAQRGGSFAPLAAEAQVPAFGQRVTTFLTTKKDPSLESLTDLISPEERMSEANYSTCLINLAKKYNNSATSDTDKLKIQQLLIDLTAKRAMPSETAEYSDVKNLPFLKNLTCVEPALKPPRRKGRGEESPERTPSRGRGRTPPPEPRSQSREGEDHTRSSSVPIGERSPTTNATPRRSQSARPRRPGEISPELTTPVEETPSEITNPNEGILQVGDFYYRVTFLRGDKIAEGLKPGDPAYLESAQKVMELMGTLHTFEGASLLPLQQTTTLNLTEGTATTGTATQAPLEFQEKPTAEAAIKRTGVEIEGIAANKVSFSGLPNYSNSCYANAATAFLFSQPNAIELFQDRDNDTNLQKNLKKILRELYEQLHAPEPDQEKIKSLQKALFQKLNLINDTTNPSQEKITPFKPNEPNDAPKFLECIFQNLRYNPVSLGQQRTYLSTQNGSNPLTQPALTTSFVWHLPHKPGVELNLQELIDGFSTVKEQFCYVPSLGNFYHTDSTNFQNSNLEYQAALKKLNTQKNLPEQLTENSDNVEQQDYLALNEAQQLNSFSIAVPAGTTIADRITIPFHTHNDAGALEESLKVDMVLNSILISVPGHFFSLVRNGNRWEMHNDATVNFIENSKDKNAQEVLTEILTAQGIKATQCPLVLGFSPTTSTLAVEVTPPADPRNPSPTPQRRGKSPTAGRYTPPLRERPVPPPPEGGAQPLTPLQTAQNAVTEAKAKLKTTTDVNTIAQAELRQLNQQKGKKEKNTVARAKAVAKAKATEQARAEAAQELKRAEAALSAEQQKDIRAKMAEKTTRATEQQKRRKRKK